jgi:DNA anti-recombination protein RmuC
VKLSEELEKWRIDRPDEWKMDEFMRNAEKLESERDTAIAQNLEQLNNCLAALQIANKRIDELEKYNLDLANESHNKSNMIDHERNKNAKASRAGFVAGYHKMHIEFVGSLALNESAEFAADQYSEKVRRVE